MLCEAFPVEGLYSDWAAIAFHFHQQASEMEEWDLVTHWRWMQQVVRLQKAMEKR